MNNQIVVFLLTASLLWGCGKKTEKMDSSQSAPNVSREDSIKGNTTDVIPENTPGKLETELMAKGLVDIQNIDSTIFVDLKYSTTDNFVGADVYGDLKNCYLQPEVAKMLQQAHDYLKTEHPDFRFLVYDGVRPLHVQQILWDTLDVPLKDKPKYVSDPKKGSIHNYGAAVDLTLADAEGNPLDMGTGYDHFGYLAYPVYEDELLKSGELNEEQVQNRRILRSVMEKAGFSPITSEWWHFNAFSRKEAATKYEIVE